VKEIAAQMDEWTRQVWEARQVGYSWKEIADHLGQNEQSTKMKFRYGLEKTRRRLADLSPKVKPKGPSKDDRD
jgi:DNA-directed RNA polymerase specialized sigma24 family protein